MHSFSSADIVIALIVLCALVFVGWKLFKKGSCCGCESSSSCSGGSCSCSSAKKVVDDMEKRFQN